MNAREFDGAVLAGGLSIRMGRDKGQLTIGGEPLLSRQLQMLKEVGADPRWVSVRSKSEIPAGIPPDVGILRDLDSGIGPMAGLTRVFESMRHGLVLIVAVDLPALDVPFLQRLVARSTPECGVISEWRGQLEPLIAIYPLSGGLQLSDSLKRGQFGLQQWARQGITDGWLRIWHLDDQEAQHILNWNWPTEFAES